MSAPKGYTVVSWCPGTKCDPCQTVYSAQVWITGSSYEPPYTPLIYIAYATQTAGRVTLTGILTIVNDKIEPPQTYTLPVSITVWAEIGYWAYGTPLPPTNTGILLTTGQTIADLKISQIGNILISGVLGATLYAVPVPATTKAFPSMLAPERQRLKRL